MTRSFAYSVFAVERLNTVSERVRTESKYFPGHRKNCDAAKRAGIEFLVGTSLSAMRRSLKTVRLPPYQRQISGWAVKPTSPIELSVLLLAKPNRTLGLAITFL